MSRTRKAICILLGALLSLPAAAAEIRVGIGAGIGFLPLFISRDLDLIEAAARKAGVDIKPTYQFFSGSGAMQTAVLSGSVDVGVYGLQPLLIGWDKSQGTRQELIGISGVTTLPLVLLTNRRDVASLADLKPNDRIAMAAAAGPTLYLLQMAAEKSFGFSQYNKFNSQIVELPHPESINALTNGKTEVSAYFGSPPFTQIALKNPNISKVLASEDVYGGKSSFLIAAATRQTIDANPQLPEIFAKAINEAVALIRSDPDRVTKIYLKAEPSRRMDEAEVRALIVSLQDEFGSDVHGVVKNSEFMSRVGALKRPPRSWKDVFHKAIHETNSD